MSYGRNENNNDQVIDNTVKTTLDALALQVDGMNGYLFSITDDMDSITRGFYKGSRIAPAFLIELCKNMLPYMKEGNTELINNFGKVMLRSTTNTMINVAMGIPTVYSAGMLVFDKVGDILLNENEMAALELSINNLNTKMNEDGLNFGESVLLKELNSLKYDSQLTGNLFKLPARFTELINNTFYEISSYVIDNINALGSNIENTQNKSITGNIASAIPTNNTATTNMNFGKSNHEALSQDFANAHHDIIDIQNKVEVAKSTNLAEVRNRINADYDYSSPKNTIQIYHLPKNDWESDANKEPGLIRENSISHGSIHASNDNRDGRLQWRAELPVPLGLAVLGAKAAVDKIRDLKTPDHAKHIYDSLRLLADSYKEVKIGNLSLSLDGLKNFATKNFHGLSKSELITQREQGVINTINKALDALPNDVNLRRECGYIICAIKNKCPEMLDHYFSNEDAKSIHNKLDSQYQVNMNRDMDNFISLGKDQSTKAFQAASDLVSKYPYESHVHKIMAIAAKDVGNYDLALKEVEQCHALMQDNIHAMQKNCRDEQPDYLSGADSSRNQLAAFSKQFNSNIDQIKITILQKAIADSSDNTRNHYREQLVNLIHDTLKTNPGNVSYYDMLVKLHVNDNQYNKAIEYQSKIVELNKSPLSLIQLADLYFKSGDSVKGYETFDKLSNTFKAGSKEYDDAQSYLREWHGSHDSEAITDTKLSSATKQVQIKNSQNKLAKSSRLASSSNFFTGIKPKNSKNIASENHTEDKKNVSVRNKDKIIAEKVEKHSQENYHLTKKADSMIALISLLANMKLRDRALNDTARKSLVALTSVISLVKSSMPLFARCMGEKNSLSKQTHNIQNWNMLLTCASLLHSLVQELKQQGVMKKSDHHDQVSIQLAFQTASLIPVLYEISFMEIIKTAKNDPTAIFFSATSILSTGLHIHQSVCKLYKMELYDSYDYHFVANSLWIAPAVYSIATNLGVVAYATGQIAGGLAVIWAEPFTGTWMLTQGVGTLGGVTIAACIGADYCAESDRVSALAHNAQLLAEKEDYLGAIGKLDESLKSKPDVKVEMQRGLYHCQHHFKQENNEKVKEEATKWLQKKDISADDRLNFLNFRLLISIKNSGVSNDADELWGMYTAFAGNPDNKTENESSKFRDALKNNMAMLLYKSATESGDPLSSINKLDHAKKLLPNDDSIPKLRRIFEYDYDYKSGNQSQLLEKCVSSLTTNPKDSLALKYSGLVSMQQKKYKSSQHYFNLWVMAEPDNVQPHALLSRSALLQEDLVAAKIYAKNAMELSKKLYDENTNQPLVNTDKPQLNQDQLDELKSQYLESKKNYATIQQGIITLYTNSLAQSAGRVSAEAVGMLAGNFCKLFSENNERNSTSHFSFSMWQKPGSYFNHSGGQHSNSYGCSRRLF